MSPAPFSHSDDLRRLRAEGYFVQIVGGFLAMREVPYVDRDRKVRRGTLFCPLDLAGEQTTRPGTHVIQWTGDFPCDPSGNQLAALRHQDQEVNFGNGLVARHAFSSKPAEGYRDYYHKMSTYAAAIAGPAAVVKSGETALTFTVPDETEGSVFEYTETASDRVGIGALTHRLADDRVAIVGVGGTGSYVLDLVAKTPVREIRLIDADEFLQHNAFRAPGAPTIEELRDAPPKVEYLRSIYARMRKGITAYRVTIGPANLGLLDDITFAFLCMDAGEAKRTVIDKLEAIGASFIDVGMGLQLDGGSLGGILRVTASTPAKRSHVHAGRIPLEGGGAGDVYATNIQVADLNALNAALAVIKWKKLKGFYRDLDREHHSLYTTDGNLLTNQEGDDAS